MSAASYPGLMLEQQGHTAVVTLSNPPAHTWTHESLASLARLVRDLEADSQVYALVITGCLYLLMSYPLSLLARRLEAKQEEEEDAAA